MLPALRMTLFFSMRPQIASKNKSFIRCHASVPFIMPTTGPVANQFISILSVSPCRDDHAAVRSALCGAPVMVATADSCQSALRRVSQGGISIVICEGELPDGTWRDFLACEGADGERALLIVTSRLADVRLWAEVLNLGGFDVIAKPFVSAELRRVLITACMRTRKGALVAA